MINGYFIDSEQMHMINNLTMQPCSIKHYIFFKSDTVMLWQALSTKSTINV